MRKLKLELEELVVESFITGRHGSSGTVKGHDSTDQTYCGCETAQTGDGCVDQGANLTFGTIGCQNTAFPCQSVNACNTDACDISFQFPRLCGVISWPGCSAKCTNIVQCTTPDMGC